MRKNIFFSLKLVVILAVLVIGGVFFYIFRAIRYEHEAANFRVTYTGLLYLANGASDYKAHKGVWPSSIQEMRGFRVDFAKPTTDAYGNAAILKPYDEAAGFGELISYGRDGKVGGADFNEDIVVRFPVETKENMEWNKAVEKRFLEFRLSTLHN